MSSVRMNKIVLVYSTLASTEGKFYIQPNGQIVDDRLQANQSTGASGLSFGTFEHDALNNTAARNQFRSMVDDAVAAGRISQSLGNTYKDWVDPTKAHHIFSAAELATITENVIGPAGNKVLGLDITRLDFVLDSIDEAEGLVKSHWGNLGVLDPAHPDYQLAIGHLASWSNRTEGLDTFQRYLSGESVQGLPPLTSAPTLANILYYLQNQTQFQNNPGELDNVTGNIERGLDLYNGLLDLVDLPQLDRNDPTIPASWLPLMPDSNPDPVADHAMPPWLQDGVAPLYGMSQWLGSYTGGNGYSSASPLILDLDGDGIELVQINTPGSVYWDIDLDGFGEASGWVKPDDGLLVLDRNNDGIINDHSELFGNKTVDGFTVLSALNTNGDTKISVADTQFSDLRIWKDINQDGFSQSDELFTLTSLNIASINLNATQVNYQLNGNQVTHEAVYTLANGTTHTIVDAWFTYSDVNSIYSADYLLDTRVVFLPALRGYGTLPDLSIAMSQNETLLQKVQAFSETPLTTLFSNTYDLNAVVRDILHTWAGVQNLDEASRGINKSARDLAFMEHLMGDPSGTLQNTYYQVPAVYHEAMGRTIDTFATRLVLQSAGAELFTVAPKYNPSTDLFEGSWSINTTGIQAIIAATANTWDKLPLAWLKILGFYDQTVGLVNFDATTKSTLDSLIQANDPSGALNYAKLEQAFKSTGALPTGDAGNNLLIAVSDQNGHLNNPDGLGGNDTLYGAQKANSTIYGGADSDTLIGGSTNTSLIGGSGDDKYVFAGRNSSWGIDNVVEYANEGTDTIYIGDGITPDQIRIWYDGFAQKIIISSVSNPNYTMEILALRNTQTGEIDLNSRIERIEFSNGTVWDISQGIRLIDDDTVGHNLDGSSGSDQIFGNGGGDSLYGYGGNDTLYGGLGDDFLGGGTGNDVLIGGSGRDQLSGDAGDDTYVINAGEFTGSNGYYELVQELNGSSYGYDRIVLGAGLNPENFFVWTDTAYPYYNLTLQSTSDLNSRIQISYGLDYYTGEVDVVDRIEEIVFGNGVIWNIAQGLQLNDSSESHNLVGSAQGDLIFGNAGNDIINSYRGNDIIDGGSGNDYISAGDGDDQIAGGDGDDYLYGEAGNDLYVYSSGLDYIYDGGGIDKLQFNSNYNPYNSILSASKIILQSGINEITFGNIGEIEKYKFSGFADMTLAQYQLYQTNSNDSFTATSIAEIFHGGLGSDTVSYANSTAGVTVDLTGAIANSGGDAVGDILNTIENLTGSAYGDFLYGDAGVNILNGGANSDFLEGGAGADTLNGGSGNDTVRYTRSAAGVTVNLLTNVNSGGDAQGDNLTSIENITGSAYADVLTGSNGNDQLNGGNGNDILYGGLGIDTLYGEGNDDTLYGGDGNDNLYGGSNNDIVYGDAGNDNINGNDGDDVLIGGAGADSFNGGNGIDTVDYSGNTVAVTINLATNTASGGDAAGDTFNTIEKIKGSAYNDSLTGSAGNDILEGGAGNDALDGAAGNDTYIYVSGLDSITDVSGTDIVQFDAAWAPAQAAVSGNTITFNAGTNVLTFADINAIETFRFNGYADMTLAQLLTYGSVNDTFTATSAADNFNGGSGTDTVTYVNATAAVTVDLLNNVHTGTYAAGDVLTSIENLTGSSYSDTLYGDANANTIVASGGNDFLEGGAGADVLDGGSGNDTVQYTRSAAGVTVNLATNTGSGGDAQGDTFASIENVTGSASADTITGGIAGETLKGQNGNDILNGGDGNDVLMGEGNDDTLHGDNGNDTLYGGSGTDILYGDAGADIFRFSVSSMGTIDTIKDFSTAQADKLNIQDILVGWNATTKVITDYIELTTSGANTIMKVDRDGLGTAYTWSQTATLENVTGLTDEQALLNSGNIVA